MNKSNLPTSDVKSNANSASAANSSRGTRQTRTNSNSETKSIFPRTDAGNAEFFAHEYKDKLRYDYGGRRWLLWSNHWWAEDPCQTVLQMAKEAARKRLRVRFVLRDTKAEGKAEGAWAHKSESRARLEATLEIAKSEPSLATSGGEWDASPWLFGAVNGVINLRTGKLREGKRSDLLTMHTEVAFDPEAQCPRWLRFLEDIFGGDRELIGYIHRALGYCLSGATTEQVVFLCYGHGSNGKSTFLDVLRSVLGDYAYNLPFSTFELKSRSAIPNDVAALAKRRFVTALETNECAPLNEARIKLLTGCDPVSARFLYREFFTFTPVAKFWLATNHKPPVADDSPGFWRRIRLIPFLNQFTGREDKNLGAKLKAEAPGILRWAVEGCLLWQREGLGVPAVVKAASQAYREENDKVGEFLDEGYEIAPDATIPAAELWSDYLQWTDSNQDRPLDRKVFSARLEGRGFRKQRVGHNRNWTWFGLSRKTPQAPKPKPVAVDLRTHADVKSPLLNGI
jgi:putative DNA primase/helicase